MSYAVILVAWLAMMPQLVPKQRTDFFDWAMSTLLPAVTFPAAKRLAIFLDWAGSGSPHQYLAANMTFAKLHFASLFMTPFSFCAKSVPSMIVFPGGDDLLRYCDS